MVLTWVCVAAAFVLIGLGSPIFLAFGLTMSVAAAWSLGLDTSMIVSKLWANLDSFAFLAAPLFILAGNIMTYGGLSRSLVDFVNSLVKHVWGGLAVAVVVACAIFAAMCGSVIATAGAIGLIMHGHMVERGYPKEFSGAIIASAATLGPIIPPSIWMVVYGSMTETNVAELFLAGFLPGVLLALALATVAVIIARRGKFALAKPATWPERGKALANAWAALIAPLIILGGIYGGIFTPTEAGAVASVYALLIGLFVYKGLKKDVLLKTIRDSVNVTANICLLVTTAILMGFVISQLGVPDAIARAFQQAGLGLAVFSLLLMVLLLILGMFLEAICIMVLVVPTLFPVALALGMDPIHYGLVLCVGLAAGQVSPPFGVTVFTVASFTSQSSEGIFRAAMPMLMAMIVVMLLVTLVPGISLFLPELMRNR